MVYSGGSAAPAPPSPPLNSIILQVNEDTTEKKGKATERVANLLGGDLERRDLFCQMDVLREYREDMVWKEMARRVNNFAFILSCINPLYTE